MDRKQNKFYYGFGLEALPNDHGSIVGWKLNLRKGLELTGKTLKDIFNQIPDPLNKD